MTTLNDIFNDLREEGILERAPKRQVKRDTAWLESYYGQSASASVESDYDAGNVIEVSA